MTDTPNLVKIKCRTCDGKGVCRECGGRTKTNIGVLGEVEVQCTSCSGSGKCINCNGVGDIWVQDNKPLW